MSMKPGAYKYVKVNDEYRFAGIFAEHSSLIKEGESAQSAGTIGIHEAGHWRYLDRWSMSLKIGSQDSDIEALAALIGLPMRNIT